MIVNKKQYFALRGDAGFCYTLPSIDDATGIASLRRLAGTKNILRKWSRYLEIVTLEVLFKKEGGKNET